MFGRRKSLHNITRHVDNDDNTFNTVDHHLYCPTCLYDLYGLTADILRCPECGLLCTGNRVIQDQIREQFTSTFIDRLLYFMIQVCIIGLLLTLTLSLIMVVSVCVITFMSYFILVLRIKKRYPHNNGISTYMIAYWSAPIALSICFIGTLSLDRITFMPTVIRDTCVLISAALVASIVNNSTAMYLSRLRHRQVDRILQRYQRVLKPEQQHDIPITSS